MQVSQTQHYLEPAKRLRIACRLVEGAAFNMVKNLKYYENRGRDLAGLIEAITEWTCQVYQAKDVQTLMGMEGNIRHLYYQAFDLILNDFSMGNRSRQPPLNEVNALISFGNMMCYTTCLDMIYHTQLNPTISFLHEPGARRYSLALDLAEIFKPMLVDRTIFKILNKKELQTKDFDVQLNKVILKEGGRKKFVKAWEERLQETIKHRSLKRSVSYKHLIKLECYKLSKHILGIEGYQPFKAWW